MRRTSVSICDGGALSMAACMSSLETALYYNRTNAAGNAAEHPSHPRARAAQPWNAPRRQSAQPVVESQFSRIRPLGKCMCADEAHRTADERTAYTGNPRSGLSRAIDRQGCCTPYLQVCSYLAGRISGTPFSALVPVAACGIRLAAAVSPGHADRTLQARIGSASKQP